MKKQINTVELFAGAGGLALGLEKAGFNNVLLNEIDRECCKTLNINRPQWKVINKDIKDVIWEEEIDHNIRVDMITGGFPCQAFSQAGKRLGLQDTRGTLFYEFGRAIKELNPKCFLAENVKGLLSHDNGKTLELILSTFKELGYHVYKPILVNSNDYGVAQKRERIFIFGVLEKYKDKINFIAPPKIPRISLKDIFITGEHYKINVEDIESSCAKYSEKKIELFKMIKPGENWKSLPIEVQKEYLGKAYYSTGGKTGILKRLSMNEASPTILTSPSQKQTERCHPQYTRPLSIRECARIQSFPDDWLFIGSMNSQYKQIGNAVPVNLAYHIGKYIKEQYSSIF